MPIGKINISSKKREIEWRIEHFFSLPEEDGLWYFSPSFSYDGQLWYLGIYPMGNRKTDSLGYVDLEIWREFCCDPINAEVSIAIKTVHGINEKERHGAGDEFVSFRCISRSELARRKTEFVPFGALTVVCTINILNLTEHASASATEMCPYCERCFDSGSISYHKKKCMDKPIKCPECTDVILLQNWYEHECQLTSAKNDCPLCQDFQKVLLDGSNHDLILKVGDKELRAHQDVLRARSQVFKSMLSHDMKEKKSGVIDVPDCEPQVMELFLLYVYTGKIEKLDESNMLELYYIADKYEMKDLKEECCSFIKKVLAPANCCKVIQLALSHSDSNLQEYASKYFMNNVLDILNTVEWQSFMKENSTVANELLIKSFKNKK